MHSIRGVLTNLVFLMAFHTLLTTSRITIFVAFHFPRKHSPIIWIEMDYDNME